jgi:hypothetical protein
MNSSAFSLSEPQGTLPWFRPVQEREIIIEKQVRVNPAGPIILRVIPVESTPDINVLPAATVINVAEDNECPIIAVNGSNVGSMVLFDFRH